MKKSLSAIANIRGGLTSRGDGTVLKDASGDVFYLRIGDVNQYGVVSTEMANRISLNREMFARFEVKRDAGRVLVSLEARAAA